MKKKAKNNKGSHSPAVVAGELRRDAEELALLEGRWKILGDAKPPKNPPAKYQYVDELVRLQFELLKMQEWVRLRGLKVCVLFEGRDAAGKGGVIKRITECLNPRVCRVVALGTPTERERSQWYFQRYVAHLPAAGEIVLFDRSWYNRAGVEVVMGFCTEAQHERFLVLCPQFEHAVVDDGIFLVKFWLEVSDEEQKRRFEARIKDPLRQWKLSPIDLPSRGKWYEYSRARDVMFKATNTDFAPWIIVPSDDKKRARLNVIRHLLKVIPHKDAPRTKIKLPKRSTKGAYDDVASLKGMRFVEETA